MLNLLRADLFRMMKNKNTWVIIGIAVIFTFASLALMSYFINTDQTGLGTADHGSGLTIEIPEGSPMLDATSLGGLVESLFAGNTVVVMIIIFAVLFAGGNIRSGYIKSIAGVGGHKYKFLLSEGVIVCLFTAVLIILLTGAAVIGGLVFFDNLGFAGFSRVLPYLGLQFIMLSGLGLVVIAFTEISRSNLVSLLVWIIYTGGFGLSIIGLIEGLINRLSFISEPITLGNYLIFGNLMVLTPENMGEHWLRIICVTLVISVVAMIFGAISKEIRDVK